MGGNRIDGQRNSVREACSRLHRVGRGAGLATWRQVGVADFACGACRPRSSRARACSRLRKALVALRSRGLSDWQSEDGNRSIALGVDHRLDVVPSSLSHLCQNSLLHIRREPVPGADDFGKVCWQIPVHAWYTLFVYGCVWVLCGFVGLAAFVSPVAEVAKVLGYW